MSCWNFWNKKKKNKPFKIQFFNIPDSRVGVVASSITELIEKACNKFNVSYNDISYIWLQLLYQSVIYDVQCTSDTV